MRKKFREKDEEVVRKGLESKLPIGAKMSLILPTEEWASHVQMVHQAATGKSLEELRKEFDYPCPKETGKIKECEDCDHYKDILDCAKREYKDKETGEIKEGSAPCDYMFDSGDLCVNCPSAQFLIFGIDCPCPSPGIYRYGEPEYDFDLDEEEEWEMYEDEYPGVSES